MERQTAARRRLIKRLERLDLDELPDRLSFRDGLVDWIRDRYAVRSTWGPAMRRRLSRRAAALARAVDDAGGVYFPRRVHKVRVAAKKLRYALEIAVAIGLWRPRHMLKDLREVQATLGDLHDVQVLVDELGDLVPRAPALPDMPPLAALLRARAHEHHRAYLTMRDRLKAIAEAVDRFTRRVDRRRHLALAVRSAAGVPVSLLVRAPVALLVHAAPRALPRP
jgi:CHAD domain-containing protein